jgi:RNA polymerase sigma factor (sigma-70 family)
MGTTAAIIDSTLITDRGSRDKLGREMDDALLRFRSRFCRSALRYLGNAADAEDAVQDALLSAYKHLSKFRGQARISTWLSAIVINSARMQLRRRSRQPHVALDEQSPEQESHALCDRLADRGQTPEEACRGPNLQSTFIGCCDSSHLRCGEHFNCANWTASPFAKPRMFSESLKAR